MLIDTVKTVLLSTFSQIMNVLGAFLLFGFILFLLAKWTRNCFQYSRNFLLDIFVTGWIGTPVHELGHAIFALIFGHKIKEMKLFNPDLFSGSMGYVKHSWNKKNLYHRTGNFFIGVGPIILGTLLIAGLLFLLVPNSRQIFYLLFSGNFNLYSQGDIVNQAKILFDTGGELIKLIFDHSNFLHFRFWIFLYLSLCISSHMELSPPDIKGMFDGFFVIILILLSLNLILSIFRVDADPYISKFNGASSAAAGLFFFAVVVSFCNFILTYISMSLFSAAVFKKRFNPFL
ncbi:DUF3267 domain-containing protein [candidate division WOR-3 bacterium]|nr:DUF3267 domain-containing protein [candidate division WOR-3 bacterium]